MRSLPSPMIRLPLVLLLLGSPFSTAALAAQTLTLNSGWNLISLYAEPNPATLTFAQLFQDSRIEAVFAATPQGEWLPYHNSTQSGELAHQPVIERLNQGLWVKTTAPLTLELTGADHPFTTQSLQLGWNLIGLNRAATTTADLATLLASTPFTPQRLLTFKSDGWYTRDFIQQRGSLTELSPHQGFWLYLATNPNAVVMDRTTPYTYLNSMRQMAGLNLYTINAHLEQSAAAHANWIVLNDITGHYEMEGTSGFTGITPVDRAQAAGYLSGVGEVGTTNVEQFVESLDGLMGAIYHRFGLMNMSYDEIGFGSAQDSAGGATYSFFGNNGNSLLGALCSEPSFTGLGQYYWLCEPPIRVEASRYETARDYWLHQNPEFTIWPVNHATHVIPVFYEESPDPLPDLSVSGYPISIEFNTAKVTTVTVNTFRLFNERTNTEITHTRLLDESHDINQKLTSHQFALFPLERLDYATPYRVELNYIQDGVPKERIWYFTTLNPIEPIYTVTTSGQRLTVPSGQTLTIYIPPTPSAPYIQSYRSQYSSNSTLSVDFFDKNTLTVTFTGAVGSEARITVEALTFTLALQ